MKDWKQILAAVSSVGLALIGAVITPSICEADELETKPTQTLNIDYSHETGSFKGGASGTLYGLGDAGSPPDSILDGAQVENSSQKPPSGTQHPSGDSLALENQFLNNGGKELAVYMQDYYPDWPYNYGIRPGDDRSYKLDVPVSDPSYGTYTSGSDGRWDYEEVTEIVVNKILANSEHPDQYTFIPFNEPDGGNWYNTGDDSSKELFRKTFLADWNSEYTLIQQIWNQYKNGEKKAKVKPTKSLARIAGPGDSSWRQNRSDAFLKWAKNNGTLPSVFIWHELGRNSLESYRSHYSSYRELEKRYGISPIDVNITEYGELRDMSVPGQLIQWMGMFEDTKVQAETAYWNYAGNLSDNMARTNSANAGWWMLKWYGDLHGTNTVKVTSKNPNVMDNLQGIAAIDTGNRKATVLYGGANDSNSNPIDNTGKDIPVKIHMTGLDTNTFGMDVDVEVRENVYTGPDGVAGTPRVVNVASNRSIKNGTLDIMTMSVDRYASYQLIVTPHQSRDLQIDGADNGKTLFVEEAEDTQLDGAQIYEKTPQPRGWGEFMFSGNHDVGSFAEGDTATWKVSVPTKGIYRFQVISGNTGFSGTNLVSVNDEPVAELQYGAELANKDETKWKYRGSAETLIALDKGENSIVVHGSSADNTLDKFLLYQIRSTDTTERDIEEYPASQFRLKNGAELKYAGNGTDGFADLGTGSADVFAHSWDGGYSNVSVQYNARKGSKIRLEANKGVATELTAEYDGLQTSTVQIALVEGINEIQLTSGKDVLIEAVMTKRTPDSDGSSKFFEAENLQMYGGAKIVENESSNASGKSYVVGLGSQFDTEETGASGFGDRTRVKVLDFNNAHR